MKPLILLLGLLISSYSFSTSLYVGLVTDHLVEGNFNENNKVGLIQLDNGITYGSMINSYNNESILIGYTQPDKTLSFGLMFATGYEPENFYLEDYIDSLPVIPMPIVSLNIDLTSSLEVSVNYIFYVVNLGIKINF